MEIVITVIALAILFSAAFAGISAAPWLPTKPRERRHIIERLAWRAGMQVVDLGCGDGSPLFAIARAHPEVICVGYDISLLPLLLAWGRKLLRPSAYKNVHIRFGNLYQQNLAEFDRIFIFLLPKSYPKLVSKFRAELKAEAEVVVEAWPLPDVSPTRTLTEDNLLPVYIYSAAAFHGKAKAE